MLVLSRKIGESVRIGDEVIVTVVEIRGDKVLLGFSAPVDVPIHREEVWRAIRDAGGGQSYAHLYDGERYLGPTKCTSKRSAQDAVRTHAAHGLGHWGMVSDSEEPPPRVDTRPKSG